MSQHYTKNTKQVLHYCPTCNRQTMHRVDDRRLGCCLENHRPAALSRFDSEVTRAERLAIMTICGNCSEDDAQRFCDRHPELYGYGENVDERQGALF